MSTLDTHRDGRETEPGALAPGTLLGPYRVNVCLGAGAVGTVYLAEHAVSKMPCVCKALHPEVSGSEELRALLIDMVRVCGDLSSHASVPVRDALLQGDPGVLVYDAVLDEQGPPARNLLELLEPVRALSPEEIRGLAVRMGQALRGTHEAGVIHGCLKPANILVPNGDVRHARVSDMGCGELLKLAWMRIVKAARTDRNGPRLPAPVLRALRQIGWYRAPEVLHGAPVSVEADLYSAGLILLQVLSGMPPEHLAEGTGRRLRRVPTQWRALLDGCLRAAPEERIGSAAEFLNAIPSLWALSGRGNGVRPAESKPEPVLAPEPGVRSVLNTFEPGMTVGEYELGDCLGYGGIGAVFRACRRETREPVAIKILGPAQGARGDRLLERFEEQAEILKKLRHRSVVAPLDTGVCGDYPYLACELFLGPFGKPMTLDDYIEPGSRATPSSVKAITAKLLQALRRVHGSGLVHGDIKPGNVLFRYRETISKDGREMWHVSMKLTDVGVALIVGQEELLAMMAQSRALAANEGPLEADTLALLAMHGYVSPEQSLGEDPTELSDIYAVGKIVRHMLLGTDSEMSVLPTDGRPELDEGWDRLVETACRLDPAHRYPSARAMRDNLLSIPAGDEE